MRGWKRRDQREPSIERRPVILADTHARPSRAATAAAAIPPSHLLPDHRRSPPRRRRPPPRAAYRSPTASSSVSSGSRCPLLPLPNSKQSLRARERLAAPSSLLHLYWICRRRYGPGLIGSLHREKEMFSLLQGVLDWEGHELLNSAFSNIIFVIQSFSS
uniref:Uncharacterized protein n=1 Tax=Oryza barthii TaxID=65489 RepID=A0A0D3EX73_9ORYZ